MRSRLRTREKVLLGLFAVLAVFQGVRVLSSRWGSGDIPLLRGGSSSLRSAAQSAAIAEVMPLDLEALEGSRAQLEVGRNPFRYVARATPTPLPPPPPRFEPPPVEVPTPFPSGPQPPEVDLTFLGSFGPQQRKIAVFTDGQTIYNAMVGDVLERKFIVHAIGYESVDLGFVDFPDEAPERLAVGG